MTPSLGLTIQNYLGPVNFVTANNEDFPFTGTFRDSSGALINWTGATGKMQVRRAATDNVAVIDFGNTAGTTLTFGGVAGTVAAYAPQLLMETVGPGTYVWDLVITLSGVTLTWLSGTFEVTPGVSR